MSETVHYKGTLKMCIKNYGESLEDQCKRILENEKNKIFDGYYSSYKEMLLDEFYQEYIEYDNILYLVVEKKNVEPDGDIFMMSEHSDRTISFEVRYYNGGCGFNEAIEYAFENKR